MAFKNVGTFDLGRAASGAARGGNAAVFSLDADGIASGQAFLTSELEKRDMMVRTPLTSFISRSALEADGRRLYPPCR